VSGSTSKFLDTRGNATLGIGVCARCSTKRPLGQLMSDPNASGLKVCKDPSEGCIDKYDPYRLPARRPDPITLPFYRPDERLEEPTFDTADVWLREG
jgi:hypothetical protein